MNAQHKAYMDKFDIIIRELQAMGGDMRAMAGDVPITDAERIKNALGSCSRMRTALNGNCGITHHTFIAVIEGLLGRDGQ